MVTLRLVPRLAPTLDETIRALTDYGSAPEDFDLLALVEWITQTHKASPVELPNGTFGNCHHCDLPWPCPAWEETRILALNWLIRSSTTRISASRDTLRSQT